MRAHDRLQSFTATLLIAAAVALLSAALAPVPATAQSAPTTPTTTAESPPSRVELVAQDASTPVGGDVNMRFDITNAPAGARLYFTILFSVRTRPAFDAAFVAGTLSNNVLGFFSVPLENIPTTDAGARALTVGLQSAAQEPDRLNVREPGVYPLKIELRDASNRIVSNSFVTALVVSQPDGRASVAERLRFAWVWPFAAAPSYLPNGEPDPDVARRAPARAGGWVVKRSPCTTTPDIPVTVVPGPETMEAWLQAGLENVSVDAGAASVQAAGAAHQALGDTYVPIDIPSLLDHGLEHCRRRRADPGQRSVRHEGGSQPGHPDPTRSSGIARGTRPASRRTGSTASSSMAPRSRRPRTGPRIAPTLTTPVRINAPVVGATRWKRWSPTWGCRTSSTPTCPLRFGPSSCSRDSA